MPEQSSHLHYRRHNFAVLIDALVLVLLLSGCHTISVLVQQRQGSMQAIVEDDGHGFDPAAARREGRSEGIHGMVERTELVGGSLEIESSSEGTTVYVAIPTQTGG